MSAARKTAEKPAKKTTAKTAGQTTAAGTEKAVRAPAVDEGRLMTILLAPVISEKATFIADKHNQVIFRVRQDATKKDVKAAVEMLFKVEVESVQILNQRGKTRRFGRHSGRRDNVRKAYVGLKPGHEINFAEGVK